MTTTGHTKPQLGCVVLYPDPSTHDAESTVDVVAIPGLGAHPDWTWIYTSKESGSRSVNWLKDPDMLPAAIPNARIMRFGYESTWIGADSTHQRLSLIGEQLLRSLEDQRRECRTRPIVFIAHSMGGNVLQKALLFAKLHSEKHAHDFGDILKSTVGIIFLGTPFRGSKSAELAQIFTRVTSLFIESDNSLINQINLGSESLRDLLYDFCLLINRNSIPVFCFFEQHSTDLGRIARRKLSLFPTYNEIMVDEVSACIDCFSKLALTADHLNLNKFQSSNDNNYKLVRQEIQRLICQAPSFLEARLNPRKLVQDESLVNEDNQECLHALFATNPLDDMSRIQSTKDTLLEGSCSWMFGDLTYTGWLNSRQSRTLWIHGDPGKGKTMLTMAVITELSTRLEHFDSSNSMLAYFFCDDKDDRTNNAVAILRGLLYQILCQHPKLFGLLESEYKKQGAELFESRNALQTLWRILQSMLLESKLEKVYLIVDAIDECDFDSRTVLLRLMEQNLNDRITETVSGSAVKWMLTSRNDASIKEALLDSLSISLELNSDQVDVAVSKFIGVKVEHLKKKKRYSGVQESLVQETLRNKAEGTFLWVSLACAELEKARAIEGAMRNALERLPRGLEGIYTQILEKAVADDQADIADMTKEILKAVSIAIRPLTLHELACVADIPKESWNDRNLLSEYISQCGSLLTIRGISNVKDQSGEHVIPRHATVHLVHQSAKDFLISPEAKRLLSLDLAEEHATMVSRCLSYICSGVLANGTVVDSSSSDSDSESSDAGSNSEPEKVGIECSEVRVGDAHVNDIATTEQNDDNLDRPPLLKYPILHWMSHGREAKSTVGDVFDVYQDFFEPKSPIRKSWLDSYRKLSKSREFSGICYNSHILLFGTCIGIRALVKKILDGSKSDSTIDIKDRNGSTALMLAADRGYKSVVELLLEQGADAEARDRWGNTALILSVTSEDPAVTSVLLNHGVSVHPENKNGATALSHASIYGQETVVKLLLQHGANYEISNDSMDRALEWAAQFGHIAIVQLLLKERAFIDRDNSSERKPLIRAAMEGHEKVVELLLRHGANVIASDEARFSALMIAAAEGHNTVVELLLSHGADVDSVDKIGCLALSIAAIKGNEDTCKTLLKYEATLRIPNREEDDAIPAVCWAALKFNERQVKTLLEFDILSPRECDLLGLAARQGYEALIKVLLEHKVAVTTETMEIDTASLFAKFDVNYFRYSLPNQETFKALIDSQHKALLLILRSRKERLGIRTEESDKTKPVNSGI